MLYKASHAHDCGRSGGFGEIKPGPFCFATDGTQLFVGGEFTPVNNKAQEGLASSRRTRRPRSVLAPGRGFRTLGSIAGRAQHPAQVQHRLGIDVLLPGRVEEFGL